MAISGEEISFVGYAFVDDADLVVTCEGADDNYEGVAQQMQRAIDEWEGGIRATGGAVEPTKTHCYCMFSSIGNCCGGCVAGTRIGQCRRSLPRSLDIQQEHDFGLAWTVVDDEVFVSCNI